MEKTRQYRYEILKKAEVKRRAERLTKKELCRMCNVSYNFYMNCLNKRGLASDAMTKGLQEYLETPTAEVYRNVFSQRDFEEEFHHNLEITLDEADKIEEEMEKAGVLAKPL